MKKRNEDEPCFIASPRPGHKIHSLKSEPNRKNPICTRLKSKKYPNGSCKVVQNISESKVLLTKPERVTRKTEKTKKSKKISEETGPNVQTNIQCNYIKHEYILQIFNFIFILIWYLTISI